MNAFCTEIHIRKQRWTLNGKTKAECCCQVKSRSATTAGSATVHQQYGEEDARETHYVCMTDFQSSLCNWQDFLVPQPPPKIKTNIPEDLRSENS